MTEQAAPYIPSAPGCRPRVHAPTRPVHRVASDIAEAAWAGKGVRVFAWPCGTVAVVRVGSAADELLTRLIPAQLLATWTRGARFGDVLAELQAARGRT
jgi:hypothetical protein